MADFLTAVKSVRVQAKADDNDEHLIAVESTSASTRPTKDLSYVQAVEKQARPKTRKGVVSPDDALDLLRSQPDLDDVLAVLGMLASNTYQPFNIHAPGPLQAQIINIILTTIIPDFWSVLRKQDVQSFAALLRNVAGLNAIVARLRLLSPQTSTSRKQGSSQSIQSLLEVAGYVLAGDLVLELVHRNLCGAVPDKVKREMAWKESVTLIGSGKIPANLAQAVDAVEDKESLNLVVGELSNGATYSAWLGRNIGELAECSSSVPKDSAETTAPAAQVLAKALNIGYYNQLLAGLFGSFAERMQEEPKQRDLIRSLLQSLPLHANRPFIEQLFRWLSTLHNSEAETSLSDPTKQIQEVATIASLLAAVASADDALRQNMVTSITDPALSATQSLTLRRACVTTISHFSTDSDELQQLTEKLMFSFNDQLFSSHAPIIQQEALAQTLLLTAGYLHRQAPMALLMTARSSNHMQGVSNRLDTSNTRARWLGMIVGTAISGLVDKEGAKMSFGTDDMETEEARWYMSLVRIDDRVGRLEDLDGLLTKQNQPRSITRRAGRSTTLKDMPKINGKPTFGPPRPPAQTEVIGEKVTEILDGDEDEEDDDLRPYAKPDSDPEDSDEDATLVNRKKARAPVYIRDLMAMLRDDQNHDRFQLGIKNAARLIRRKTDFGSEVKDHANEIGVILCNLRDPFDTDDFDTLKLQAMIAVILSDVKSMAPWFSKQVFIGEYSISQRCIMLSALGLSGRELAGFKNEDELNPKLAVESFPSKRLPSRLHAIYDQPASSVKRLEKASSDVEQALIKPLALQAADQSTAHLNAVKVRTFSSRMDVERTKRKPAANALAKLFGSSYFFPLVNRYQQEVAAYGSASVYSSVPFVLVTFVKTVAILLHAAGPATVSLSELSGEFWDLLLSLRVKAAQDIKVLHAVLFSLLTILEMNTDKRQIVYDHPKRLMETQQWVDVIFERSGGSGLIGEGGNDEETKVRTLAAGVLVKCKEIIGAYQMELIGFS